MVPEFLFDLLSKLRIVHHDLKEPLFSDRHAVHFCVGNMDESVSLLIHNLEAANYCRWTVLAPQKNFVVNFISNVIFASFYEEYLKTLFHFIANNLIRHIFSDLQRIHHVFDKGAIHFIIEFVIREYKVDSAKQALVFILFDLYICFISFFAKHGRLELILIVHVEKAPEVPQKVAEQEVFVNLGLAI